MQASRSNIDLQLRNADDIIIEDDKLRIIIHFHS